MNVRHLLLLAGLAGCLPAQVVLTFDALSLADYSPIPESYGDGLDPNIPDVQYRSLNPDFSLYSGFIEFWNSGYGDLQKVAYADANGLVAEITFVPATGYGVQIDRFDLAGYFQVDRPAAVLRLVDMAGNVLWNAASAGPVTVQGSGATHSTFTPNLVHLGALRLQWGTDWNIGIDNIQFSAVAIPEPSTWGLFAGGVAIVVFWSGRHWRRRAR